MKVAFIGHRNVEKTQALRDKLMRVSEKLIVNEQADTFLFGSRSEFNNLCYEVVTELCKRYSYIRRIFVRAEYEYVNKDYMEYLLENYEDTFYPQSVHGAGVNSYIKRNQVMIDMCDALVAYFDENYIPQTKTKSGTKIALNYARKKNKRVINLFDSRR